MGVFNIINPTLSRATLKRRTKKACNEDMSTVLKQLIKKYPNANVFVLGYYQIVADRIRRHAKELASLLEVLNVCDSEDLKGIDFVSRAVENCKLFWQESDRQLLRAVAGVNANTAGTVSFLPSTYTPANGLFGKSPLLFNLGDRDPLFDDWVLPCTRAILAGRTKAHCYIAPIGHPNKPGATRYLNIIKKRGMSRALLKLSGGSVHDYATISADSPSPNRASRARRAATSAGIS